MRVLKFGGTSMGDEHTWRKILGIIVEYDAPAVIVSATTRTTRQLVAAAQQASRHLDQAHEIAKKIRDRHIGLVENFLVHYPSPATEEITSNCTNWINCRVNNLNGLLTEISDKGKTTPELNDAIASIGEQLSAYLFAQCARAYGLETTWVDASEIIKTDDTFGQAIPQRELISESVCTLAQKSADGAIPIMGGFYGSDSNGRTTTLGFEGSDYTASLVGAALQAEAIEIWTDVSGIYTCDPRVVSGARPIAELSYQEATDLAYFGAKVLHPSTLKPAAEKNIPVYVKNIFEPDHPGTKIHEHRSQKSCAKAITYLNDIAMVTLTARDSQDGHQFLARVFNIFDEYKISVNAVTTTEASVSVALKKARITEELKAKLSKAGTLYITNNYGLVSLIGCSFDKVCTIQERVLECIPSLSPSLISYSRSKHNFNIAVYETRLIPAVCRIHEWLFEPELQPQE